VHGTTSSLVDACACWRLEDEMNLKCSRFEWQQGYGTFSLSISQQLQTNGYINSQAKHHQCHNFEEEFIAFLKKHNIEYDPR
jgi:hypothetical protein